MLNIIDQKIEYELITCCIATVILEFYGTKSEEPQEIMIAKDLRETTGARNIRNIRNNKELLRHS